MIRRLELGADDGLILEALRAADKAGIDCPFGWPVPFVKFLAEHQAGELEAPAYAGRAWRRDLALRLTDQRVYERIRLTPMSVSANLIAHVAMRCAALLARLAAEGKPVDRCGRGVVVEVYPAASLVAWGLVHKGYKTPEGLGKLVDEIRATAAWLDFGPYEKICRSHHDAFDAVIAALAARAAALGLATAPEHDEIEIAAKEGWIALPTAPLDRLR